MQLPLTDADTLFAELLQDLPSKTAQMACECKAFVQTKKVKTPVQLLRVVEEQWLASSSAWSALGAAQGVGRTERICSRGATVP
jgi:hypothetical protein